MNTPTRRSNQNLDALLGALPRELPPARDLWPAIEAAMVVPEPRAHQPRRRWPYALAAGLALAVLGGFVGARFAAPPDLADAAHGRSASPDGTLAVGDLRSIQVRDSEFTATRAELVKTYQERLKVLSPLTRARISADLMTIRRAENDLRDALVSDPGSRVLMRLYESTTRQEFDLYTTIGRNTEPAAPRTRT